MNSRNWCLVQVMNAVVFALIVPAASLADAPLRTGFLFVQAQDHPLAKQEALAVLYQGQEKIVLDDRDTGEDVFRKVRIACERFNRRTPEQAVQREKEFYEVAEAAYRRFPTSCELQALFAYATYAYHEAGEAVLTIADRVSDVDKCPGIAVVLERCFESMALTGRSALQQRERGQEISAE